MNRVDSTIFILYVADQERSATFYTKVFGLDPVLNAQGMTEFHVLENVRLGLMPETGIARIICPTLPQPAEANGVPRCEVYFLVPFASEWMARAVAAGGIRVSELATRDWGHDVGYVADPDRHILAFASVTGGI